MHVTILIMRADRSLVTIGVIRLTNPKLVANPPHSALLQDIIQTPIDVTIEGQRRELHSDTAPQLFLEYLHHVYNGPYVTATPPQPE